MLYLLTLHLSAVGVGGSSYTSLEDFYFDFSNFRIFFRIRYYFLVLNSILVKLKSLYKKVSIKICLGLFLLENYVFWNF
jgi:hypothetical protein